jgi:hypothetical protein
MYFGKRIKLIATSKVQWCHYPAYRQAGPPIRRVTLPIPLQVLGSLFTINESNCEGNTLMTEYYDVQFCFNGSLRD